MADISVHEIAFKGFAGITYILLMWALVFYVLAFATTEWSSWKPGGGRTSGVGIWQVCSYLDADCELSNSNFCSIFEAPFHEKFCR